MGLKSSNLRFLPEYGHSHVTPQLAGYHTSLTISTMLNKQLFPLLLICFVVAVATTTAAFTTAVMCNLVYSSLKSCLGYVLGGGLSSVSSKCCSGIKFVLNAARTSADR
ncbi:hypothetical protein RDI58_020379 [Solanum bulbocastanum]|uniref:Uncharacterized protein n=1 Tax=Solanum bulbocastanum TaxID=147425 RepID=A0AAN8T676_SOLBU